MNKTKEDLFKRAIFNLSSTTKNEQTNYYLFQMRVFIRDCFRELGLNNLITSEYEISNFIKENEIQIIYIPSDFKTDRNSIIRIICKKQNYNKEKVIKD